MGSLRVRRVATSLAIALAAVAPLGGCTKTRLVVEMKPAGNGFERRITAYELDPADSLARRQPPHLDAALTERLARVYGVRPDTSRPYTAARRFTAVPEDVGNWGRWTVDRSPLGDAFHYLERLGGDPDPQGTLAARLAAADSIAAWLRAWSVSTSGPRRGSRLARYLERDLARELRNAATLDWAREATADSNVGALLDVDQVEHAVAYDLWLATVESPSRLVLMRPPAADTAAVALHGLMLAYFESELSAVGGSRRAALAAAGWDSMQARIGRHPFDAPGETPAESLRWARVHERLATESSLYGGRLGSGHLEVRLAAGVMPIETNGWWDAASGVVSWSSGARGAGDGALPLACHARWATPDSVRQRRLFGRVLLRDEALASYCAWYAGQPPARRAAWDRMLLALRPGELGPLERFTFAGGRAAADPSVGGDAAVPRMLILEAARGTR